MALPSDILGRLGLGPLESGANVQRGPGGPPSGAWVEAGMRRLADSYKNTQPTYRTERGMIDIKHRLMTEYAIRDMLFRFLERIYDGEFWRIVASQVLDGGFHYKRYQQDDKYRLVVNYIFSTINNYVDLLGQNASIHVPPLQDADDAAVDLAKQNEKILYGIWEASQMEAQMQNSAWYASLLGSTAVESTPDIEDYIPKISIEHPGLYYPKVRFGKANEYLYGIKRFFLDPDQVSDAYGASWRDRGLYVTMDTATGQWIQSDHFTKNAAKVECWYFYSPWERALFIQDRVLDDYSIQFNESREIPWRIIPFFPRPGKTYGVGAAEQAWGLNQYINQLTSQQANIIAYAANPMIMVKNGQNVDDKIPNDPGAVINVAEDGDVKWLGPPHPSQDLTQAVQQSRKFLEDITGMPEVRYGNIRQSFATGRAIEQLSAPVADRIQSRRRTMSAEFQHINRIALKQFELIAKNKTVELFGSSQEMGAFNLKVKGSEVRGYYRNFVTWDNHDHSDTVELLQLGGAGWIDRKTGLTALGYREPDQILERVHKEKLQDIEFMRLAALAQAAPIPPADVAGQAPGKLTNDILKAAQPMQQQAGLENGAIPGPGGPGGMPAPPGPQSAGPLGGPPAGPVSGGPNPGAANALLGQGPQAPISPVRKGFGPGAGLHNANGGTFHLGQVISDFKALPVGKIKGQIYLFGHITDGAAAKVQVFLTQGVDKATIINALPDYKGHLIFQTGKTPPSGAVDVTPVGAAPPVPSPAGAPPPPGGLPPLPGDNGPWAPGNKSNPIGLQGPLRQDHLVTPVYQQLPTPPPGVGPLSAPGGAAPLTTRR